MRSIVIPSLVACVLTFSPTVVTGQPCKRPSKEECERLRNAVVVAQTAYSKAHAAFRKAQGDQKRAEANVTAAKNALQKNSDSQEAVQADIDRWTRAAEQCQTKNPNSPCSKERNDVFQAKKRLQKLKDARLRLELDLTEAEDWLRQKNADLEANTAKDASTMEQLEAARAKYAASNCGRACA